MSLEQTYAFYTVTGVLVVILAGRSEKTGRITALMIGAVLLSLVAGLRAYSVGVDTYPYSIGTQYFAETGQVSWQYAFSYGYGVFTRALYSIYNDYTFLLIIQALLTNILVFIRFWDFREVASLRYMVFVFLTTFYLYELCIICQSLAVALVFFATRYLDRGKPIVFLVITVLATALHMSAMVGFAAFFFYLIYLKKLSQGKALLRILAFSGIVVGLFAASNMFISRYAHYFSLSSNIGLMVFVQTIVFIVSLFVFGYLRTGRETGLEAACNKRSEALKVSNLPVSMYSLGLIMSASSYLVANAGRISFYGIVFAPVVYGILVKNQTKSKSVWFYATLLSFWFVAFFIYAFIGNDSLGVFPYAFVWMES